MKVGLGTELIGKRTELSKKRERPSSEDVNRL